MLARPSPVFRTPSQAVLRVPVLNIKEWAGHSTQAVTEKYMRLRPPGAADATLKEMRL